MFKQCDFHIHSHLSGCARAEMRLQPIVDTCVERGIRHMGITDHIFPHTDPAILEITRTELPRIHKPMPVYLGCEADITSVGSHTATEEMKATLDYIMVSSNHYQLPWVAQPPSDAPRAVAEHYLSMFIYACSLEFADVIAHPMVEVSGKFDPASLALLTEGELMQAIRLAKKNNIAMEISRRALIDSHVDTRVRFYSLCKEAGVRFAIGSDAHALANVGQVSILENLINRIGITDRDIWLPDDGEGS